MSTIKDEFETNLRRFIEQNGWDELERVIVEVMGWKLVQEVRIYQHPTDLASKITITKGQIPPLPLGEGRGEGVPQ